jgi:hypothetical protein
MGGRILSGRTMPKHLTSTGKGWREDQASGFVREAHDVVRDRRQGLTTPEHADITPGFGTFHPQDVRALGVLDDPSEIHNGIPVDKLALSKQDLGISDREVELSIREGRAPRRGY